MIYYGRKTFQDYLDFDPAWLFERIHKSVVDVWIPLVALPWISHELYIPVLVRGLIMCHLLDTVPIQNKSWGTMYYHNIDIWYHLMTFTYIRYLHSYLHNYMFYSCPSFVGVHTNFLNTKRQTLAGEENDARGFWAVEFRETTVRCFPVNKWDPANHGGLNKKLGFNMIQTSV